MSCCGGGTWMMWLGPLLLAALLVGGVVVALVLWTRVRSELTGHKRLDTP